MHPPPTSLADLPPELLDHITSHLPTARTLANLGQTSTRLHAFVEQDGWLTFARHRFPSIHSSDTTSASHAKQVARTLTTLSKAWDRRAFLARHVEPRRDIRTFPGHVRVEQWKRPRGQTIGFAPHIDCIVEDGATPWSERKEVLAYSAGAEVCVRERWWAGEKGERWFTYRPPGALEGRDDVSALHLLRSAAADDGERGWKVVFGTVNGNLQLLSLNVDGDPGVSTTSFSTRASSVRASSLWQSPSHSPLLAVTLDDHRVALYDLTSDAADTNASTSTPTASFSEICVQLPNSRQRAYRTWSTTFLSRDLLAVGLGPDTEPLHIYSLTPTGLSAAPTRKFSLQNNLDRLEDEITLSGFAKQTVSSIYPVVPLSPTSGANGSGSSEGQVLVSGAYDGIVRVHDLRSPRDVERSYSNPTTDTAIYCLLPRGRELLLAGSNKHGMLNIFDLRMGEKRYSYLDATPPASAYRPVTKGFNGLRQRCDPPNDTNSSDRRDWSLFLNFFPGSRHRRGGGNHSSTRRSTESSVYSLCSPSPALPYVYVGMESTVMELAFTSIMDPHPDPAFFPPPPPPPPPPPSHSSSFATATAGGKIEGRQGARRGGGGGDVFAAGINTNEIQDLSMYSHQGPLRLYSQDRADEKVRLRDRSRPCRWWEEQAWEGLDTRWQAGDAQ